MSQNALSRKVNGNGKVILVTHPAAELLVEIKFLQVKSKLFRTEVI